METIIELLKVIPWWQLTVLILALFFRADIRRAFQRLLHLKYKEFEATFKEELREAEIKAKAVEFPAAKEMKGLLKSEEPATNYEQLARIADVSPRAAIVEAWREVEAAINEISEKHGISKGRGVLVTKHVEDLISKGVLPISFRGIYNQLRHLRNQVVHASDMAIEQTEAEQYINLALNLAEQIRFIARQ